MINTTELTGVQKNANQHRISRLIVEAPSDELRQLAAEVEQYTDQLIEALESRTVTAAAADVLAERQRQISFEGWTPEHDDKHSDGEMALAASSYALYAHKRPIAPAIPYNWPWEPEWFKQQGARRDLVKAGALILAEIERLDRADSGSKDRNQPGMVVAVHIDAGDFVKFRGQVYEVKETDFDDHDVTLWFVCGETLKCAAGCQIEVVSAPREAE
ncbi:Ead/Ea22-like family protein [Klebsiella michiganensis]|uniref:hypothetical protein n=1 Tax=Klebsiella TaxID=570 RepID=UPI0024A9F502|nr:hypothetical protein [Klebsiella pneumoniae]HDO7098583.1 hypothetical protein [Klebsiella pneumoniae]